jgi:transposase
MAAPVPLRDDFDAAALRGLAKASRDPGQLRRLLSLAEIYDGGPRGVAAKVGGVGLQTVRDWVLRFNAGGPGGLIDPKPPGKAAKLNEAQRRALVQVVEAGPDPAIHGVVRWRLADLVQWVWEEFRIEISVQTLSRELRALGYRKLSARPRHYAQDAEAMAAFKKTSPPSWKRSRTKRLGART